MGADARSRSREREKGRDREDRGGGDGRLREDDRGGLSRGPRGPAPERPGAPRGGGMYDARGPDRGFDPRGESRGLDRGGGVGGYQRGGRPMEGRGGPVGMPAMMGPPRVGPDDRNQPVDREKQCPMLIRIFCKFGEHHRDEEFSYTQQPVEDEVLVHTWRDATLSEITELLAQEHRQVRQSGTKCTFKVVFPSAEGKYVSRVLGSTAIGRRLPDDISTQTLAQIRFQVGDFISVAIHPPKAAGRGDEKVDRIRSEASRRDGDGEEEEKSSHKNGDKPDKSRRSAEGAHPENADE